MEAKKLCSLICTILILVSVTILSIRLCGSVRSSSSNIDFEPECGELHEIGYARSGSQRISFANEWKYYLDAYKRNDTDEMEKTLDFLKSVQIEETDVFEAVARKRVKTLVMKINVHSKIKSNKLKSKFPVRDIRIGRISSGSTFCDYVRWIHSSIRSDSFKV